MEVKVEHVERTSIIFVQYVESPCPLRVVIYFGKVHPNLPSSQHNNLNSKLNRGEHYHLIITYVLKK